MYKSGGGGSRNNLKGRKDLEECLLMRRLALSLNGVLEQEEDEEISASRIDRFCVDDGKMELE